MVASAYSVGHRGVETFSLPPDELWGEITDAHRFERWWSWLRNLELQPDRVETGATLTFSIVSPLPYQMDCVVDFVEVVEQERIEAVVAGDLKGWANLSVAPHEGGSRLVLEWELEPTQAPMRLLVRVARPIIMRTKDWAIDVALNSFRRNVGA